MCLQGSNPKYDNHSGGDKLGRDAKQLLKGFVDACKLDAWVFCHLTSYTAKMIRQFRSLLGATLSFSAQHTQNRILLECACKVSAALNSIELDTSQQMVAPYSCAFDPRSKLSLQRRRQWV